MQHHKLLPFEAENQENDHRGWCETTWGALATLEYGKSLRGYETSVGHYKVYGTNGQIGWHSEPLCPQAGVVIGRKGVYRGVHYSPEPFCVIDTAFYLKPKTEIDVRWAYYQLLTQDINSMDSGSAIPSTSRDDFYALPVRIPPLPEQRAIAHILGTLDDKIELNRRMNQTLEEMARAIYKDWFVDFGPTRAKLEGREPYLAPELWELFPDRLVDSELGDIPEGWEVKKFERLLGDVIGGDWGKGTPDSANAEAVSIIRGTDLSDVRNGGVGSVPVRYTTSKKLERRMLQDGDIIIEVSGGSPTQPTGRSMLITAGVLERFSTPVVCASFCRRFRPLGWEEGLIAAQHLDYLNKVGKMWEYQLQSTGIANFQTKRFLEEEPVAWPGNQLANEFAHILNSIVRHVSANENLTLKEKRDILLPKLVSGELTVNQNLQGSSLNEISWTERGQVFDVNT